MLPSLYFLIYLPALFFSISSAFLCSGVPGCPPLYTLEPPGAEQQITINASTDPDTVCIATVGPPCDRCVDMGPETLYCFFGTSTTGTEHPGDTSNLSVELTLPPCFSDTYRVEVDIAAYVNIGFDEEDIVQLDYYCTAEVSSTQINGLPSDLRVLTEYSGPSNGMNILRGVLDNLDFIRARNVIYPKCYEMGPCMNNMFTVTLRVGTTSPAELIGLSRLEVFCEAGCSASSSMTQSSSSSVTPSNTISPSISTTPSETSSSSMTSSESISSTTSMSETATRSESKTSSISITASESFTQSASFSATSSKSFSLTTSTSNTPSVSLSKSLSLSVSQSESSSISTSQTTSLSIEASQSVTPTISTSNTQSRSMSPSSSTTLSASLSVSPSNSVPRSATASMSNSETRLPSRSTSPSASISSAISDSRNPTVTPSSSLSISSSPTSSGSRGKSSTVSASKSSTVSTSTSTALSVSNTRSVTKSNTSSLVRSVSSSNSRSISRSKTTSLTTSPSISNTPVESPALTNTPSASKFPSSSPTKSLRLLVGPDDVISTSITIAPSIPNQVAIEEDESEYWLTNSYQTEYEVDGETVQISIARPDLDLVLDVSEPSEDAVEQGGDDLATLVVNITLLDANGLPTQPSGDITICFEAPEGRNREDLCLGSYDEEHREWVCDDVCLESSDSSFCGNTDHLTNFALLLNGGSGSDCDGSVHDFILGSAWNDFFLILACVLFCACIVCSIVFISCTRHTAKHKKLDIRVTYISN